MAFTVPKTTNNFSGLPHYPLPYQCNACHINLKEELVKRCSRCKVAIYCGVDCQTKDWEAFHRKECKKPAIDTTILYTNENAGIRRDFATFNSQLLKKTENNDHVFQTQKSILEGSGHLNPDKSVVVVCGAQFYGDKFIEPLPQLLEKCKKLILLDVDPVTLEKLHLMLGISSKVSTVALDLTCALKDLPAFCRDSLKLSQHEYISKISNFLDKVTAETEKRAAGLPGVLRETASADYVISSLVASQLSIRLKETIFSLFKEKFGSPISSALTPQLFDKIALVLRKNVHALIIKHTEDLCAWAGQKGRVYFADTHKFNNINTLITERTLNEVENILNKRKGANELQKKDWHWIANQNFDYNVRSLLS